MPKTRESAPVLFVVMLFGALIGTVLGEILIFLAPGGLMEKIFTRAITFGLHPPGTLDLKVLSFTLGFSFKMNLMSLLGILLATIIYKKI